MTQHKEITVVYYGFLPASQGWTPNFDASKFPAFIASLDEKFRPIGVAVRFVEEAEHALEVKGYADLLNTVRLRSPADHIGNLCLGHVIGQSINCDLFEDVRRGVSRVAFAPETIEPEGSNKIVCHNCGCGC